MDTKLLLWILFAIFSPSYCATVQIQANQSEYETVQKNRSRGIDFRDLLVCGISRDVSCFLDTADVLVEEKMNDVLAQADLEVIKATGRADEETAPSHLSKTISRIISELTELFRDGISGFFKSAKEGEDDEVEENAEKARSNSQKKSAKVEEPRKKKKKGKLIALIKLIIIGIVIKAKLTLLLKALSAALQIKFFLVALAGLILNAARFYLDLKKGHQPQKVIYYEHAQHQHHYEGEEDWSSAPGGSYWGRSYDEEEAAAQDLAYAKQKPIRKIKNNDSGFSLFG